jgi:putative endonuclease
MNNESSYVYILASQRNGTLYTGVTTDLVKRVGEHKEKIQEGFTKRYNVANLVHYEVHGNIVAAISREKNIKAWKRAWKIRVIEEENPQWKDLFPTICS